MNSPEPVRILIVDDDVELAETLGAVLTVGCGFPIATRFAHNGASAVASFGEYRPHIVILDIDMPVLNGFHAAAAIRAFKNDPAPLLICATGNAAHSTNEHAHFFDHFVIKPVDIERLIHILQSRRNNSAPTKHPL